MPVHAGLFAPMRTVAEGNRQLACCLHFIDAGIDSGPIIDQQHRPRPGSRAAQPDHGTGIRWRSTRCWICSTAWSALPTCRRSPRTKAGAAIAPPRRRRSAPVPRRRPPLLDTSGLRRGARPLHAERQGHGEP
ncbi:MAG: hypothetical protein IPK44_13015 [Candidatus Accumulibacter sp.]|nr:hypothetical protein [Accumulibacter sp.]